MLRRRRERAVPSLLAQGALTLASVALLLVVTIGIVLFYRRGGGS